VYPAESAVKFSSMRTANQPAPPAFALGAYSSAASSVIVAFSTFDTGQFAFAPAASS